MSFKDRYLEEASTKNKENDSSNAGTGLALAGGGALLAKKAGLLKGMAAGAAKAAKLAKLAKAGSGAAYVDPSLDRMEAAKISALYSGLGTALVNSPSAIFGGLPAGALAIGSGMAAAKGGALGAVLGGGRDTLLKSSAIPAAVVAGAAPLSNMAFDAAGYDTIEVDPVISAALTGGVGGLGWLMRNWRKKKEIV
jgi:hypothetical protein